MLLLVGTFLSLRLASPFFLVRLRMYLPSGEMAASTASPVSVTLVTEISWNGAERLRVK